jgi:Ca2+-transporting ATPase
MVLAQLAHALNCRNDRRSLFAIGLWTNKPFIWAIGVSALLQAAIVMTSPLHPIFKVTMFDPEHWWFAVGIGVSPLLAMEVWKLLAGSPRDAAMSVSRDSGKGQISRRRFTIH